MRVYRNQVESSWQAEQPDAKKNMFEIWTLRKDDVRTVLWLSIEKYIHIHAYILLYNDSRLKLAMTQFYTDFHTGWYWIDMFEIWTLRGRTVSNAIVDKDTYFYMHALILIIIHDHEFSYSRTQFVSFLIHAVTFLIQAVSFLIIFDHGWYWMILCMIPHDTGWYRMILDDTWWYSMILVDTRHWRRTTYFWRNMIQNIRWRRTPTCVSRVTVNP